jgi:osmotically-inducible protein OsmY
MGVIDRTTVTPEPRPDEDIRRNILMALLQDPATDSYQVAISVKDAVATLTGSVGSRAEKQLAARVAEGVNGIKDIRNDITINYSTKRTDKKIAADVNARLQWDVWLNSYTVSATVADEKVTLTGTVGSAISKSRAFNDAWLNGVMDVNDSGVQIQAWGLNNARPKFKSAKVSAGEIKGAVRAALRLDPRVSAFAPDPTVKDGVVILGGVVGNLKAKTAAEQDAKNISGVWETDNLLKVRPNARRSDADMGGN